MHTYHILHILLLCFLALRQLTKKVIVLMPSDWERLMLKALDTTTLSLNKVCNDHRLSDSLGGFSGNQAINAITLPR